MSRIMPLSCTTVGGMNFLELVKLQVKDINNDCIFYGRSKTGDQLSVRITDELREIMSFYLVGKSVENYLFPANYNGSTKHFEKYKTKEEGLTKILKSLP
jgi:hypothetical protein